MIKQNKLVIFFFSLLFIAIIPICAKLDLSTLTEETQEKDTLPFSVEIHAAGRRESISPWYDSKGTYYVFLPGYVQSAQITLLPNPAAPVLLNGFPPNASYPDPIVPGKQYTLQWQNGHIPENVIFLLSDSIPSVHVDVRSGNMEYIHMAKGNEEPGSLRIYDRLGNPVYSGKLRAVKGRGNATWEQEKKPYALQLWNSTDILGMGEAENWVLLPNCLDPSNLRNKFFLDYATKLGMAYTPECRWVDLYLNGEYAGLYLLCEKIEIHPERVNISEDTGLLVSREKNDRVREQEQPHVATASDVYLRIHHHNGDPAVLQTRFQTVENALAAVDGIDPVTGASWLDLIDLDSWVQKYLFEEISGNLDAGAISQFFYSNGSGKIFAGPVWDYDMSSGNQYTWQIDTPNMLYAGRPHLWSLEDTSSWYYRLSQKELFMQNLRNVYQSQFRPVLLQSLEQIPLYESQIRQASAMNSIRWNTESSSDAIIAFREYMLQRIDFLDSLWLDNATYHTVELWVNYLITACYAVPDGGTIPHPDSYFTPEDNPDIDWYSAKDDMRFDFSKPITEDTLIYLKEMPPEDTGVDIRLIFGLNNIIKYVPLAAMVTLLIPILLCDALRQKRVSRKKTGKHTAIMGDTINE